MVQPGRTVRVGSLDCTEDRAGSGLWPPVWPQKHMEPASLRLSPDQTVLPE